MVQLVFVHGVATRSGPGYAQAVANRDTLFAKSLFDGLALTVRSPLWGDLVPKIDPHVFETDAGIRSFSIGDYAVGGGMGGGISASGAAAGPTLTDVARENATAAIDAAFAELLDRADRERRELTPEELSAFQGMVDAIEAGTVPTLVQAATSDQDLAKRLGGGSAASYGIGSALGNAVSAVTDRLRNTVSTVAFGAIRGGVSPTVGLFLGDVFAYLKQGGLRDRIEAVIREDLIAAHGAAKADGTPLIVVGHSMGGVILVDMLGDLAAAALPADLRITALMTVGSQPGLFKSLGVVAGQTAADGKAPRPASVRHWFNVFDPIDPLAFRADSLFSGVRDLAFDSVTGLASAHTTYFKRPQFYARARKRLRDLGVI